MKKTRVLTLLLLVLVLVCSSVHAASAKKEKNRPEKLAVLDLEAKHGVEKSIAEAYSVLIRNEIHSYGEYEVMSTADLRAVMSREAMLQAMGCDDNGSACLVNFGRTIGTRFMVAGSLSKLGSTYIVSLRILDTKGENAGVVKRTSGSCKCSEDELIAVVQQTAAELMGKETAEMQRTREVAEKRRGKGFTDPTTGMEFVYVNGGCYQMGDTFGDGDSDEKPVHEVCVNGFYMGKYEVTQGEYQKITGANPSYFKKGNNYPVEQVSWNDGRSFISKLSNRSGKSFRLPTEAEWEYAARSGGKKEKYSGSNSPESVAWYGSNSGGTTHRVGTKSPNGLGLHDMSGNVWECCSDWYDENYYSSSSRNNPQGASSGSNRVIRGGSWGNDSGVVRLVNRGWFPPSRDYGLGFRLVFHEGS